MIVHQSLDVRLSKSHTTGKMIPLGEVSFNFDDDSSSVVSTISGDNDDQCRLSVGEKYQPSRPTQGGDESVEPPRSIFSNYWNADDSCAIRVRPSPRCIANPHKTQRRGIIVHQQPQQTVIDPYEHFGLVEDCGEERVAEDSINTYERMLQKHEISAHRNPGSSVNPNPFESRPLWLSALFGTDSRQRSLASAPSLRRLETPGDRQGQRGTLSDTALLKTPKKSCLRRGRYSCGSTLPDSSRAATVEHESKQKQREPADHAEVSFQPKIEIYFFHPPVESWAPKGWSKWFG